jgi:hypothetical protein
MRIETFKWHGQIVQGEVVSEYVSTKGTSYFVKVKEPPETPTYDRQGHVWPQKGSIILADV